MPLILKVMHTDVHPRLADTAPYSVYSDVNSAHFYEKPDGSTWARLYVQEPVKTANVPGFVECETSVHIPYDAFLINEAGRTMSRFRGTHTPESDKGPDCSQSLAGLTGAQIKHMVERFLGWKLPADFSPDNGVSFEKPTGVNAGAHWPSGTNLLNYDQVFQMVRYITDNLPGA